jgi:hypothetical protein
MTTEAPVDRLKGFLAAMNQWKRQAHQARQAAKHTANPESYWPTVIEGMNAVFAEFCTPRKRPYGRNGAFSNPPEYDPETETILEVIEDSSRRVRIITQQATGFKNKCQYVLLKQKGQWYIDNRRIIYSDGASITNTL